MSIAQKILAEPGKYSIQQLTQAVQNGVLPAYIGVPIIEEKVKLQKQSQMGQQAQQAPQGQPSIAQQVMSEAQGVQGLPTNLPQSYASGGIVAFEEGGPVQRFQVGGMGKVGVPYSATNPNAAFGEFLKQMGMTTSEYANASPGAQKNILDMFNSTKTAATAAPATAAPAVEAATGAANTGRAYGAGRALGSVVPKVGPAIVGAEVAGNLGSYKFQEPNLDTSVGGVYNALKEGNYSQAGRNLAMGLPEAGLDVVRAGAGLGDYLLPGQPLAQGLDRILKDRYGDKITVPAAQEATPAQEEVKGTPAQEVPTGTADTKGGKSGIESLLSGLGLGGESALGRAPGVGIKPPSADLVGQTQSFVDAFNKRDEARTAENERRIQELQGSVKGKAYEGLEKSLRKEAEEFGADKAQAKSMALFKAGLAMMAGTSRHALENIGKGAMVGAEDYQAAAKDIKKAQKENERAMAMVEQARRAEDLGQRDKAIARMDMANQHLAERDKFGTTALMNATGKSAELAQDAWKSIMSSQTQLAAQNISGKYHLAGSILGAMGKERMTPYQEGRLRMEAEKRVDSDALRAQLAKSLGLTKVPAPGADKGFDSKFGTLYENEVASHFNRFLGAPVGGAGQAGANPYAGYKIVP